MMLFWWLDLGNSNFCHVNRILGEEKPLNHITRREEVRITVSQKFRSSKKTQKHGCDH